MAMDWTAQEDRYMAEYRGESRYDPLAPDHGFYPACEACEAAFADLERRGRLLCVACADDAVRVEGSQATGGVPLPSDPAAAPGNVNTSARI